jgi:hypothetical protein
MRQLGGFTQAVFGGIMEKIDSKNFLQKVVEYFYTANIILFSRAKD